MAKSLNLAEGSAGTVVIVEDEAESRKAMSMALRKRHYQVEDFSNGADAIEYIDQHAGDIDLVITDLRMPGVDGLTVVKKAKEANKEISVILVTAFGSVDSAVQAMKMGADDYLTKPVDLFEFRARVSKLIKNTTLNREVQHLQSRLDKKFGFEQIIGNSAGMEKIFEQIKAVAGTNANVLILGESGTGKELVAQAIHDLGARKKHKFVAQNTGALPDTLLESELFGHRRGAFTGAATDKAGLFEIADKGTVFLDEIGEASPAMQVRLLRFLETGRFRRTGDTQERSSNVRVIAATHRNLREEVDQGRFREDLYYRLNVYPIIIAPLRDRREDIPLLVRHFVEAFNKKLDKHIDLIPRRVLKHLSEQPWQGNVRELKNFVHRMMVLSPQNTLMLPDATFETDDEGDGPVEEEDNLKTLCEMERDYLIYVLEKYRGNQTRAARCLGLKRTTFISRLKKLGIDFPGP